MFSISIAQESTEYVGSENMSLCTKIDDCIGYTFNCNVTKWSTVKVYVTCKHASLH